MFLTRHLGSKNIGESVLEGKYVFAQMPRIAGFIPRVRIAKRVRIDWVFSVRWVESVEDVF
jgi:hypothetical protein